MARRLLITGGQGFIGRNLIASWLGRHADGVVVAIGRSPRTDGHFPHTVRHRGRLFPAPVPRALRQAAKDGRYQYVQCDLLETSALTKLMAANRPDLVIHLAAALRDEPLERLLATNVSAVASLLEATAGSGAHPERIVLGSSGAVYGTPTAERLPLAEHLTCHPTDLYGMSKLAGETTAQVLAAKLGLDLVIARIFNPIGPGQDERHISAMLAMQIADRMADHGGPIEIGPLTATRDFVDVRDAAAALAFVAESGVPGEIYNIASGLETPISDVFVEGLRAGGLPADYPVSARVGHPAGVPRHFASVERIRALGYTPRFSLADSMHSLVRYYIDEVAAEEHRVAEAQPLRSMTVTATATHRYTIEVSAGLLDAVPERLATLFRGARPILLTDRTVYDLYGAKLLAGLKRVDPGAGVVLIGEGESAKSEESHQRLIGELRAAGFDRRDLLVNLGGGVVLDTGGYVAATYMRGIAYINVPTTLLAQHDAAVGGKVAVNTSYAKNFVGAFHHPRAVFVDPLTLLTLPERQIVAGVAEAIKVAMCGDEALFCLLEEEAESVRAGRDPKVLEEIVARSIRRKIELLAPDPYEADLRRALNLGHSFGHPLETEFHYRDILHGEAVAFGIAVAVEVSRARGVCDATSAARILALLHRYGLPPRLPRHRVMAAAKHMAAVRLVRGGHLHFVLPAGIAAVEIVPNVTEEEILAAIGAITSVFDEPTC